MRSWLSALVVICLALSACITEAAPDRPSGPWVTLGTGEWQTVKWGLYEAGNYEHGRCLGFDLVPPTLDEEGGERYRGKEFNCTLTADETRHKTFALNVDDMRTGLRFRFLLATVTNRAGSVNVQLDNGDDAFVALRDSALLVLMPPDREPRTITIATKGKALVCDARVVRERSRDLAIEC